MTTRSLAPLPCRTDDLSTLRVEIVDWQFQAFLAAETRSVQQFGHELEAPRAPSLLPGLAPLLPPPARWASTWAAAPARHRAAELQLEDLGVQKDKGIEGLVLRAGGNMAIDRQVGEEGADLGCTHVLRVAQAMKADKAFGPVEVASFGAGRVMAGAGSYEGGRASAAAGVGRWQLQTQDFTVEKGSASWA